MIAVSLPLLFSCSERREEKKKIIGEVMSGPAAAALHSVVTSCHVEAMRHGSGASRREARPRAPTPKLQSSRIARSPQRVDE